MFDCARDVLAYHDTEVTLPQEERDGMRDRRDATRDRLKRGLRDQGKPAPVELKSQGSYAMKTMVQYPDLDYDIDDGVYFDADDLVGPRGAPMSALDARQMVRDAVDDGTFNKKPEVRTNCVRVYYDAGYHVDLPVYRRTTKATLDGKKRFRYELASVDWKVSDARDVTQWFEKENERKSVDATNGRQVRRITRANKKYARSRSSWINSILSGFGITKLVVDEYRGDADREDVALRETMKAVHGRLVISLVVNHPVTPGDTITEGPSDPSARFLRDRLGDALKWLEPLDEADCTRERALKCWDKVFATDFFIGRLERCSSDSASAAPAVLTTGILRDLGSSPAARDAVRKDGGGRYA